MSVIVLTMLSQDGRVTPVVQAVAGACLLENMDDTGATDTPHEH